jgi:hypothetical protein
MFTTYQRQIPPTAAGLEDMGEYIRPKEYVDPDEDRFIAQIRDATVADTRHQPLHAGKKDAAFHEPHWGHTTGMLQGTLVVDRVDALPEAFRVGLFAKNASYPAVCRPNFIHDKKAKLAAGRMAVKLKYPTAVPNVYAPKGEAHELDLLFAEGSAELNGLGHAFFFRDARELAMLTTLQVPSRKTLATLLDVRNLGHIARVLKVVKGVAAFTGKPPASTNGWAGKAYFSAGPYALGEGAMKFCLRPRQTHTLEPVDISTADLAARQHAAMEAWMAAGKDAVFDLCVQLATSACIPSPGPKDPPKSVMTAEYCDLQWDEAKSPYVPVATLTFPATSQRELNEKYPWSPLQYNAWNTLPVMRPIGQLFRARKHVHKANAEARLEHIFDAKPGAMIDKAPFATTSADAGAASEAGPGARSEAGAPGEA